MKVKNKRCATRTAIGFLMLFFPARVIRIILFLNTSRNTFFDLIVFRRFSSFIQSVALELHFERELFR